ncbi:hypothetical protein GOQ29_06010 [Clostridium sp. D2Q-14]|uniref:hypothetical protein n=1 Tax=Anaeromonas gelatinilytica TaxID=2683194 RepID=UPI00193B0ECD|nr:hypothetical protein [Anaeromonas gelatinilytica]MBS4535174.1 hypothetical protein [Anaeromonas gelatinilytica]
MSDKPKICPFMSSKMNYQYCIDECNFHDEYVGCLIKFNIQEISNSSSKSENIIQAIYEKLE